jgi:predicted ester cyclase
MTSTKAIEEANKAIVLQVLERIFNRNNPPVLEEHPGLSETVAQMSRRAAAFPDLRIHVETLIAEGAKVAYVARMKGTCHKSKADGDGADAHFLEKGLNMASLCACRT